MSRNVMIWGIAIGVADFRGCTLGRPTSLELFHWIVNENTSLRALLIVTHRPEFDPPWIGRPSVTALALNRLATAK